MSRETGQRVGRWTFGGKRRGSLVVALRHCDLSLSTDAPIHILRSWTAASWLKFCSSCWLRRPVLLGGPFPVVMHRPHPSSPLKKLKTTSSPLSSRGSISRSPAVNEEGDEEEINRGGIGGTHRNEMHALLPAPIALSPPKGVMTGTMIGTSSSSGGQQQPSAAPKIKKRKRACAVREPGLAFLLRKYWEGLPTSPS